MTSRATANGGERVEVNETGAGLRWAMDCPACKYGTLQPCEVVRGAFICIDCGAVYSRKEYEKANAAAKAVGKTNRRK